MSILLSDYIKKPNTEIEKFLFEKNYYDNFVEYIIFFCPSKYNSRHNYDKNVCKLCGFNKFNYKELFDKYSDKIIPIIIQQNLRKKISIIAKGQIQTLKPTSIEKKEVINDKLIEEINLNLQIDKNFLYNFGLSSRYYKDQILSADLKIIDNERLYKLTNYVRFANMSLQTKITNYEGQGLEFLLNRILEIYTVNKELFKEIFNMDMIMMKEKIKSEIQDEMADEGDNGEFAPEEDGSTDSSDNDADDKEDVADKKNEWIHNGDS